MDKSLERDIQTLGRTEGNLKFLITSYMEGRVDYDLAEIAIYHEARFLERLIQVRLGNDFPLLSTLWQIKGLDADVEDRDQETYVIIDSCTTLIAVSKIVLDELEGGSKE